MSGTEANVAVRRRPSVVAVGVEDASVGTIVPIATAVEAPNNVNHSLCWRSRLLDGLQPPA